MKMTDQDQDLVAAALASAPPPEVSPGFLARVNARIDAERAQGDAGWMALADFRLWTLRLVPAAAALALIALLWPASTTTPASSSAATSAASSAAADFRPSSASDWQSDVNANALLEAALAGRNDAR
jgi:hypothetical protein